MLCVPPRLLAILCGMFSRRASDHERMLLSDYSALSATDLSDSDAYDSDARVAGYGTDPEGAGRHPGRNRRAPLSCSSACSLFVNGFFSTAWPRAWTIWRRVPAWRAPRWGIFSLRLALGGGRKPARWKAHRLGGQPNGAVCRRAVPACCQLLRLCPRVQSLAAGPCRHRSGPDAASGRRGPPRRRALDVRRTRHAQA